MPPGAGPGTSALSLGVDVGGTKVLGVAVDAAGTVLASARAASKLRRVGATDTGRLGPDFVLDAIGDVVGQLLELVPGRSPETVPIGVGMPGLVDDAGRLRYSPNLPAAEGLAVTDVLSGRLPGHRIVVDNDATLATLAEWAVGAATDAADAVVLTLGTGIGAGLVVEGRVVRGANGFAGEAGHVVVDPNGPPCVCGKRGCWERYASGSGLARLAREAAHGGRLDEVVAMAGGDPEAVVGEDVTRAAAAGDPGSLAVMAELGWWLGLGIANLAALLDPAVVVVGGGLVEAGEILLGPTRRAFAEIVEGGDRRPPVAIRPAALGEAAGAVGAALAARQEHRRRAGGAPDTDP